MDFHTWLTLLIGVIVICGSPGPNMLQVMACGAKYGFKRTLATMAGCFIPVFLMILASLAGAGLVLKTSPTIFDGLRYAGAAYLLYLGVMTLRAPVADKPVDTVAPGTPKTIFIHGLWVGLSNPKALLFATAFFPQFLNADAPELPQFFVMLATFTIIEIGWYMIYAFSGSRFNAAMRRASVQRNFNRATGALFLFFGAALAFKPR